MGVMYYKSGEKVEVGDLVKSLAFNGIVQKKVMPNYVNIIWLDTGLLMLYPVELLTLIRRHAEKLMNWI